MGIGWHMLTSVSSTRKWFTSLQKNNGANSQAFLGGGLRKSEKLERPPRIMANTRSFAE